MPGFNKRARTKNATLSASMGVINQITQLVVGFVFRTIFLIVLSKEYLGINGLFTNILGFLSLAELGIGSSIVYRMYKPIAMDDTDKVAAIMTFFRKVYLIIALFVAALGAALIPFLKYFIKDISEVPSDVNIYVVYLLFLTQSVISYLFVYRSSIYTADQKGYVVSFYNIVLFVASTVGKISILFVTRNFTLSLAFGIISMLIGNIIISIIATKRYPQVFNKKIKLDKGTIKEIKKDIYGMLCHRVGGVFITSSDNIILSAFIGIGVLGMYSNYSLVILSIGGLLAQVFSTFLSSIGNSKIKLSTTEYFNTYKRLLFLNLFFVSIASIAIFSLINPFIQIWIGADMLFNMELVVVLVASFFLSNMRQVNASYVFATGLFRKDKPRPIIEGLVNIVFSILLVIKLGIIGIFLGTIISNFTIVFWREPYLIYKNEFDKKPFKYYIVVFAFIFITIALSALMYYIFSFMPNNLGYLVIKFLLCAIIPTSVLLLLTIRFPENKYFRSLVRNALIRLFDKIKRKKSLTETEVDIQENIINKENISTKGDNQ